MNYANMNMSSFYGCFTMLCQDQNGQTRLLPFFRTVSEQISITNNVAKHPLDSGLYVNDHVTYEPETFDVSFNVNAYPITEKVTIDEFKRNADSFGEEYSTAITDSRGFDRIEAYRNELMKYRNAKWELNTTRHGALDDYMIVSVSISAPDSGQSVDVKINFQKVRFGAATSVLLPTIPQAVKAAAMASGKGPGGMNISEIFGGMDMDWGLDGILKQLKAQSLALSLSGVSAGETAPEQSPAEYGDISEFGQSTPDSAETLGDSFLP